MVSPARQFNAVADEERVLEVVRELVAELGHESALRSASPASHLDRDLGLGSLERVELLLRLEKTFGTRLDEEVLAGADTVQDLIAALSAANGAPAAVQRARAEAAVRATEFPSRTGGRSSLRGDVSGSAAASRARGRVSNPPDFLRGRRRKRRRSRSANFLKEPSASRPISRSAASGAATRSP